MSAISTILARLRAAIWAIDVRDDIANAIEQCYSDVSNPTLKTEALEAALQTKIDQGEMAALTIGDGTITAAKLANGVIPAADTTLTTSGGYADAKKTGDEITALKADLGALNGMSNYQRNVEGYFYPFISSLKSAGTKDFSFVGVENYDDSGAYHHKVVTPNNANTDLLGLKAFNVPALFNGDFTISMWYSADADCFGHPFEYATYVNYNASGSGGESDNVGGNAYFSNLSVHSQNFTAEIQNRVSTSPAFVGLLFWFSQADRRLIFAAYNHNATRLSWVNIYFPNSIDTTEWHHYAFTRNGDTLRFFFDGEMILSMSCLASTVYPAGQIAIGNLFEQTLANRKNLTTTKYGEKYKDLYISDECKWTTAFDPTKILY